MEIETYVQFGLALVFVLALIGLLGLMLRRLGYGGPALSRGRQRRLSVVEVAAVDAKRRLVLVRRDDVEHLLLLGTGDDIVVERGIGRPADFRETLRDAPAPAFRQRDASR
ncbi:MAG TPA: flagellar biosynthetic protein FliO [Arenibaculum sp.]|nr:flagellar biosynthetic protein FliO [Arenibaculum sp.]